MASAAVPQVPGQERCRGRTIDVVITEDRNLLRAHNRVGNPHRRCLHPREDVRVRHQPLEGWIEKRFDHVRFHTTASQNARQQLGQAVPLRNGEGPRLPARIQPIVPRAPGH